MEEIFSEIFARFDLPNCSSVAGTESGILTRFQHSQQRRLDEAERRIGSLLGPFRFSQGSQFGELRMMLDMMRLEIYCCLDVTEVGIVAWSRRTDVASGKEVTVPRPKDEKFYGLISD
jgi:hypothetical protein